MFRFTRLFVATSAIVIFGCSGGSGDSRETIINTTSVDAGKRLFFETRFAQFFKAYLDSGGNVNDTLPAGDPVVALTESVAPGQGFPGPFAGMSINCRACHLVEEHAAKPGGGMRTYNDFAPRSPVPNRSDGKRTAPRNAPPLVNASLDRPAGAIFHFDGEFNSMTDLLAGTYTGRNFGWLPGQRAEANHHIAQVIRGDDGTGSIARRFDGLPYRILLSASVPAEFRLPVDSATDQQLFDGILRLVAAYVDDLRFSQNDPNGTPVRSPFDVFLDLNGLPSRPDPNELPLDYSRRLRTLVNGLATPRFVTANPNRPDGRFQFHTQNFEFGAMQLQGLKVFLSEPQTIPPSAAELAQGQIGNCIACHAAPNFTDFKLHNIGVAQKEYDDIHGTGQFALLSIPGLAQRDAAPQNYLPATHEHPNYQEPFRAIPAAGFPVLTDLGVWNVFANVDMPAPQAKLTTILCDDQQPCPLSDSTLLDRAIARFKTPGLRDLGHSGPYMHNGQFATLDDTINLYILMAFRARQGTLRNGASALQGIALTGSETAPLAAFLRSLDEDFQ